MPLFDPVIFDPAIFDAELLGFRIEIAPVSAGASAGTPALSKDFGVNYSGGEFGAKGTIGSEGTHWILPGGLVETDAAGHARNDYFAGKGLTVHRLCFTRERAQPVAFGALTTATMDGIVEALDKAEEDGIKLILDCHNYARFSPSGDASETPMTSADGPALGDMWQKIAAVVKDHPALYGYEDMNEPHDLADETGDFSGTVRYPWDTTTEGWAGGDGNTTLTHDAAHGGSLKVVKTGLGAGYNNIRADDVGQLLGGALSGNVLRMFVYLEAGTPGSWKARAEWQNASFAWQTPTNGFVNITAGVLTEVTSLFASITSPNAFGLQVEANDASTASVTFHVSVYEQGDLDAGGLTAAEVSHRISQDVVDAIRTEDMTHWIICDGYGWASASGWRVNNEDMNIVDPAGQLLYGAHLYLDNDHSGVYDASYDVEGATPDTGTDRLAPFQEWLAEKGFRGMITEYGWPDDDARWNTTGSNLLAAINADPNLQGGTYWSGGPWWGSYPLSIEPEAPTPPGTDRPQMAALEDYPSIDQPAVPGSAATSAAVDVTASWRREASGLELGDDVLGALVHSLEVRLVDDESLGIEPALGQSVFVYNEDDSLLFTGRVASLVVEIVAAKRLFLLGCSSWGIRLLETATGSLNLSGTIEIDRNQVIAIMRDALQQQSFGDAIVDDPIVVANETEGWPLVQGTALVGGHDYSYMQASAALSLLMRDVPNVFLRVRPDLLIEYGVPVEQAAKALTTTHAGAGFALASRYNEDEITGDHRNKLRLGGEDATEVTAIDEASMARFGRIMDAPYEDDPLIPEEDLERLAYAKLRAMRVRRRMRAIAFDPGVRAGEVMHVYSEAAGPLEPEGPFLDNFFSIYARGAFDGIDAHYRGEMVVQKVGRRRIGPGPHENVTLELGDTVLDFATKLSRTVGAV